MYSPFPPYTRGLVIQVGGISGGHIIQAPGDALSVRRNACSPGSDTSTWKRWHRRRVSTVPMALWARGRYLAITQQTQETIQDPDV